MKSETNKSQQIHAQSLVNRYKVRLVRNIHMNLRIHPHIESKNDIISNKYQPLIINSKLLPKYKKQFINDHFDQVKTQVNKQTPKICSQDIGRKNKSLSRIPSISQSSNNNKTQLTQQKKHNNINNNDNLKDTATRKKICNQKQYSITHHKQKRCSCGQCSQCMKDFAYYLHLISDDRNLPQISARSWCIWRLRDEKFIYYYGKRIHKVRQIASLTKMVTAMVLIDYAQKFNFDLDKTKFGVGKSSELIGGTTARLNVGEVYSMKELLFGMMLPSGNDAAIAISEAVSLMIHLKFKKKNFDPHWDDWFEEYQNKSYSYLFINAMNQKVQRLGTIDTKFFNSHGNDAFDQLKNISTCNQIAKISSQFLKYPYLKEVVKTPEFTFRNETKVENTNKLLEDGFEGIKTGITQTAGPCLAAYYRDLIIVVLNSKSMDSRWIEVKKLVKWIRNRK